MQKPKPVHHVFVRYRDGDDFWHHETAFVDKADAEVERDCYREDPNVKACRLILGPDTLEFIGEARRKLNGDRPTSPPIVLIACSSTKRKERQEARTLYSSALFQAARGYAELLGGPWFVISAKHGLVPPAEELAPYDRKIEDLGLDRRRVWAASVAASLANRFPSGGRVVLLAGALYRRELVPFLETRGFSIDVPLEGLGIGHQKQKLKELCQCVQS